MFIIFELIYFVLFARRRQSSKRIIFFSQEIILNVYKV